MHIYFARQIVLFWYHGSGFWNSCVLNVNTGIPMSLPLHLPWQIERYNVFELLHNSELISVLGFSFIYVNGELIGSL